MRLFLAIDLPREIKKQLDENLEEFKKEYPQFRWVSCENFHITVHFFGEVRDIGKIKKKLEDTLYDQESFYLYSNDMGMFVSHKITIYLNFRREKKIEELAQKIRQVFDQQMGKNRKFVPHLTLARYRLPSKQQYFVIKKKIERLKIDISFPVNRILLFQSILEGEKPIYKKLAAIPLCDKIKK